jgi:hypothetical protein
MIRYIMPCHCSLEEFFTASVACELRAGVGVQANQKKITVEKRHKFVISWRVESFNLKHMTPSRSSDDQLSWDAPRGSREIAEQTKIISFY